MGAGPCFLSLMAESTLMMLFSNASAETQHRLQTHPTGKPKQAKEISMDRSASAVWHGGLRDGKGMISTQSGVLKDTQYSFGTRFENGVGTNPEELIAAAHASTLR